MKLPRGKSAGGFKKEIALLQEANTPVLFGLPLNIDRSVQRHNTQELKKSMLQLMAISEEGLKFDR